MKELKTLEPERVFYFFNEISRIPRGSGNEKAVSDYIARFARGNGLQVFQDDKNNLIIKKAGSAGYENSKPVIIQGHMDMVCEKNAGTEHDFTTQPIKLIVDGDYVKADGTTLGADNGIALAYAMALLEGSYAHPFLEVVLTTNEETGMDGASFLDASRLDGRRLINIDEETEGRFIVSCAGGVKSVIHVPVEYEETPKGMLLAELNVLGLKGGHSGMEIDKQRANANILMGRLLSHLSARFKIFICGLSGGLKDNAIPREAQALFYLNPSDFDAIAKIVNEKETELKAEYKAADPDIYVTFSKDENTEKTGAGVKPITKESLDKILAVLTLIPDGALFYGTDPERTVETSNNAGVMRLNDGEFTVHNAVRSSVYSRKELEREKLKYLAAITGGYVTENGDYPSWEYTAESPLRELFVETYEETYGRKPMVSAIHAGLECGIFAKKIKGADMIAFGPDIIGAHTPEEKMSISSVGRTWELLLKILEKMK